MGRNINDSVGKRKRIEEEKSNKKAEKYSTLIFIAYGVVLYLLIHHDEIKLFNVQYWYYFAFYFLNALIIYMILTLPIINKYLFKENKLTSTILISLLFAFFFSALSYFGIKYIIAKASEDSIEIENCEIIEFKKGRYRRGGDYYNVKILFKGHEESIDLDKNSFEQLENVDLNKNHAIVTTKPSFFKIYVVDEIRFQSKYISN